MCGIAGIVSISGSPLQSAASKLDVMSRLIAHRGPDGQGAWVAPGEDAGLAHRRLAIIDLSESAAQPMAGENDTHLTFNGEIYNYVELKRALSNKWRFRTESDTETILAAYEVHGDDCLQHLRGMFAFALWDNRRHRLLCARDRIGIKPFYYAIVGDQLLFASEAKALVPFLPEIETDRDALSEYLTFQYTLGEHTLFKGIRQLLPGHALSVENGKLRTWRYWDINYEIDWDHSHPFFYRRLRELLEESIDIHLRSDLPVGGYISGGIDSSLISILAARFSAQNRHFFHGTFSETPAYDESRYAALAVDAAKGQLHQIDIKATDFRDHIETAIYHLDYPVAGPGSFPQFMVSKLASEHVKVVLGGQGGDEIFGGYARYLVAYFEQCIKAAIDGTYKSGNFVVTIESVVPNLDVLREYKPMLRQFWRDGLFEDIDARYFALIDRSSDMAEEVDWGPLDKPAVFERFRAIFNNADNVRREAYFDKMTHFDFKCLLPALLHVEDRMSMAHGLESRVPFLDHPMVEFAATVPADVKFQGGHLKHMIRTAFADVLPDTLLNRRDKMGFPVPLNEWFAGELKPYLMDLFGSRVAQTRPFLRNRRVLENLAQEAPFSRKTWAFLNLEIWHRLFHDRASEWRALAQQPTAPERLLHGTATP